MAGELQVSFSRSRTVYAVLRNQTSGFIWNTSGGSSGAMEAFVSGNWANYAISLTEQGTAGYYVGNVPSPIPAGVLAVTAKEQLGGSPTQLDPTVGVGDVHWNGSIVMPLSDLATSGQLGQAIPMRLARGVAFSGFTFKMVSSADHVTNFTSGVVSGQISKDGGNFGALQSGTFTEVGLGFYKVNLTSGDLLANCVALSFSAVGISGGAADQRDFVILTQRTSGTA